MSIAVDEADPSRLEVTLDSVVLQVGDHLGVFYRGDAERDAFSIPLLRPLSMRAVASSTCATGRPPTR